MYSNCSIDYLYIQTKIHDQSFYSPISCLGAFRGLPTGLLIFGVSFAFLYLLLPLASWFFNFGSTFTLFFTSVNLLLGSS